MLVTLFALLSLLALLLASLKPLMDTVVVDAAEVLDLGAGWGAVANDPPEEKETTPSEA